LRFGVFGAGISAGAGPASAGLDTSAPVAVGVVVRVGRRVRRLAIFDAGVNEQACPPGKDDSVNLFPDLRPLSETIVGGVVDAVVAAVGDGVVAISPTCSATAV